MKGSLLRDLIALVSFSSLVSMTACSSTPDEAVEVKEETSPTAPVVQEEAPKPGPITISPACGTVGTRVVLRLGLTPEGKVPSCIRVDDFKVRFGNGRPARVYQAGPTFEGYCALDVLVPEGAESTNITVSAGRDVFESQTVFGVPCQ